LHALAGHWFFKLVAAGIVFLSLWSAAHRVRITCYDLGIRADTLVATLVYAAALAGTGASVLYLLRIGGWRPDESAACCHA
jgi:fumarate reductase subunit D